ncbi:LysE family translocator [Tropicimonas sp. S265A]|uniref:LysE family translocator n=1 Tax=Tropicimonas sp. S265A TaxID=3415134 RepID=UPI003C79EE07
MTLAAFASIALIHLMAAISPGPSFVVITRVAAADGVRNALILALAFGVGAAVWAAAAMLGLAALFQIAPVLLTALKFAGAGFLLFIAYMMWRHADDPLPLDADRAPNGAAQVFRLGLLTQLSNPKVPVFFGAVFVGILPPEITWTEKAIVLALVLLVEGGWYILVARLFSLPRARAGYVRLKRLLDRVFGGLIALFGIRIAAG